MSAQSEAPFDIPTNSTRTDATGSRLLEELRDGWFIFTNSTKTAVWRLISVLSSHCGGNKLSFMELVCTATAAAGTSVYS